LALFHLVSIGVLGEPYRYHHLRNFTRKGHFTWRVSDCEELLGSVTGDDGVGFVRLIYNSGSP